MRLFVMHDDAGVVQGLLGTRFDNTGIIPPDGLSVHVMDNYPVGDGEKNLSYRLLELHVNSKVEGMGKRPKLVQTRDGHSHDLKPLPESGEFTTGALATFVAGGQVSVEGDFIVGTLAPGAYYENFWYFLDAGSYEPAIRTVTVWDVEPDPYVATPGSNFPTLYYGATDMEFTRIWSTTWVTIEDRDVFRHQRNFRLLNPNSHIASYHIVLGIISA
ncbi:hypothetical protein [Microbispora sp. NPDC046933]|uniref:hypothetical protein n=1 Tax=Microbispora sp. NPDC046933 TaxID=3155618 RepID=UPI0033D899BA